MLQEDLRRIGKIKFGWCSEDKRAALVELVMQTEPEIAVDIGVFGGLSLLSTAAAMRENARGLVYGIDPWTVSACLEGDSGVENVNWWRKIDFDEVHRGCMRAITELDLWQNVRILAAPAQAVVEVFADDSIDILHIDGNHTEVASTRDVRLYLPKVRQDGHIWFDDCRWETTQKAAALLDAACDRVKEVGDCRLYRKW